MDALVDRVVVLPHLLQRLQGPGIGGRGFGFGLAPGGKCCVLALIARLALGLVLDETALLHRRESGSGADDVNQRD